MKSPRGAPPLPAAIQPQIERSSRFRERIREQASSGERLEDRDYEIMTMMADGIRPILDRLDEIDTRVAQMEVGDAPVPADPRGWLSEELTDTLRDPRTGGAEVAVLGRSVADLEARLPELIEETVTRRFQQMAGKLQQDIEETHVRTLETFVKNIQVKLVKRVAALEIDMGRQAEAMNQLREYSQRTEDNLSRLITGVDKLAQELPRRLTPPIVDAQTEDIPPSPQAGKTVQRRSSSRHKGVKIFWACVGAALVLASLIWFFTGRSNSADPVATAASGASSAPAPANGAASTKASLPPQGADTKTKMLAAEQYVERKDYAMAEDVYKQVIQAEPNNVDALKALASVLYRQDKIDEAAAILDRIPK